MLVLQIDRYQYFRSKDIINERGVDKLCIFACVSIKRLQRKGKLTRRCIIDGPAFFIETDVESCDSDYLNLQNEDVFYELSQEKFDELVQTSEIDQKAFILYRQEVSID